MMEYKIKTKNANETFRLAENFESEKFPNMVMCLYGELGCGKTVFAQGIAKAIGIDEDITSPTFTIVKEYEGELPFYHMDVYRLEDSKEDIGIEEYYEKNGVVVIEWADIIKDQLPEERLDIKFKIIDDDTRILVITPHGKKYEDVCEAVL
jgi:tRNA threonylcarbamoyladenosine biosynthesis protein TsaE